MGFKLGLTCIALVALTQNVVAQSFVTGPQAIVYKTKKNYRNLVPVMLSDDKSQIVSYPAPSDLKTEDGLATPAKLSKNYWLDNRGIGKNVAFLSMTYKEYAELKEVPSTTAMYQMIVDKDPLVSLCECGLRSQYKNPVKELNKLIKKKKLKTKCTTVK